MKDQVWSFACKRGRQTMEDAHFVSTDLPGNKTLLGVFDGHCGAGASRFCSRVFTRYLLANEAYSKGDYADALHQTFMQMDRFIRGSQELLAKLAPVDEHGWSMDEETAETDVDYGLIKEERGFGTLRARSRKYNPRYHYSGTTATVALVLENKVIIASVGDSFCCLVRDGKMVSLTVDHHKGLKGDDARVVKAGGDFDRNGYVSLESDPSGRTYGAIMMTRSLGDIQLKMNKDAGFEHQILSPVPDIVELDLIRSDQYLMLASDGISRSYVDNWQDIVRMCKEKEAGAPLPDSFDPPSRLDLDNATLLVIELKQSAAGDENPKPARRFSWYTQNKIQGYEAEEVDMRPWRDLRSG